MYLNRHELFEEHASQKRGFVIKNAKSILAFRIIICLIMTFVLWIWHPAVGNKLQKDFWYMTEWGLYLTWFTTLIACFNTPLQKFQYEDIRASMGQEKVKYNPFRFWKVYNCLFQLVFVMEIIITFVFWTSLWPSVHNR